MTKKAVLYKLRVSAAMATMPEIVSDIISAIGERFSLDDNAKAAMGQIDGVAYAAQFVNWLAKTENEGFYKFKNMLTRWLAMQHPGAYFDGHQLLYVPVGEDKQVSFHVHHDEEGLEAYRLAQDNEAIEWDGIKRQPLAEVYLLNHIGVGDECSKKKELENEVAVLHAA